MMEYARDDYQMERCAFAMDYAEDDDYSNEEMEEEACDLR